MNEVLRKQLSDLADEAHRCGSGSLYMILRLSEQSYAAEDGSISALARALTQAFNSRAGVSIAIGTRVAQDEEAINWPEEMD